MYESLDEHVLSFHLGKISRRHNSCYCSVAKSCHSLCDPMDYSSPGFPVLHSLTELAQARVHSICDAIQPSNPLLPPFLPPFNLAPHQGLFQWVGSLHQVSKVLEFQLQHQSFQWISSPLGLTSPCCPRDSQESSATQFKGTRGVCLNF